MTLGDPGLACHPVNSGYAESQRLARETDPRIQLVPQPNETTAENAKARRLEETSGPFTTCARDARIWLLAPREELTWRNGCCRESETLISGTWTADFTGEGQGRTVSCFEFAPAGIMAHPTDA